MPAPDKQNAGNKKFLKKYKVKSNTKIAYFAKPPVTLLLLSLFSFGLYEFYWFLKNWQAVRDTTGKKLSPFWRSVLVLFWIWPLYRLVLLQAKQRGFQKKYSAGWLVALYFAPDFALIPFSNASSFALYMLAYIVSSLISFLSILAIQEAMVANNQAIAPDRAAYTKVRRVEIVVVILGIILFCLTQLVFKGYDPQASLTPPESKEAATARQRAEQLTKQYDDCTNRLDDQASTVDETNQKSVDEYNMAVDRCEVVRKQQNQAVDAYNSLVK